MEPLLQDLRSDRRKLMKRPFVFAGIFAGIIALVFLVSSAAVNNSLKISPLRKFISTPYWAGWCFLRRRSIPPGHFSFFWIRADQASRRS